MTTPHPKGRTRRFVQFSLRSLLIFVLLVSIGMSWLGVKLERARRQREAVRVIEGAGGSVLHDYGSDGTFDESSVPKWAPELLGDDFFFDVVYVWLWDDRAFGDDEASHLKALTNLDFLVLCGTQVTDEGLEHLEGLGSLRVLALSNTQITDAGLKHLEGLTNLTALELANTQVSYAGLKHLEGLTSLEYLNLTGTQVTLEGVEKLQEALPNCEIIY